MLYCLGVIEAKDKEPVGFMMMDMETMETKTMVNTGSFLGLAAGGKILNIKSNENWDKLVYKDGYKNMPKCYAHDIGNVHNSDGYSVVYKEKLNGEIAYGVRRMFGGLELLGEQALIARAEELRMYSKSKGVSNPTAIVNACIKGLFGRKSLAKVPKYVKSRAEWGMW